MLWNWQREPDAKRVLVSELFNRTPMERMALFCYKVVPEEPDDIGWAPQSVAEHLGVRTGNLLQRSHAWWVSRRWVVRRAVQDFHGPR